MDAASRSRYEQRIRDLTDFGHRGSATEGERRASAYLFDELKGIGFEPVIETFAGIRSSGARLLLHVAIAAVGAALLWSLPGLTILFGSIALGSLALEMTTRGKIFSRLLMWSSSRNVAARLPPAGDEAKARLIICGHYDTQRTGLIWNETFWKRLTPILRRLPTLAQSLFLPVTLMMILQLFFGLAACVGANRTLVTVAGASILTVYGLTGVLLAECSVGSFVPGACDNASGAAGVLTLGEEWLKRPAEHVELILLSTGCEETGLLGAAAWADKHREEIQALPTCFLNLDGLAFGPPRFLGCEIPLVGLPEKYSPRILTICSLLAAEQGLVDAGPHTVAGFTDGLAFLVRGIVGATVVGIQDDGSLPHWHLRSDDAQRMDFDAAWRSMKFASELMFRLAAGGRDNSLFRRRSRKRP